MNFSKLTLGLQSVLAFLLGLGIINGDSTAIAEISAPPSTRYFVDVERYRFGTSPSVDNKEFYPIPDDKVTRDTYFNYVDAMKPASIAVNPDRGMAGPSSFMPVLAKYIQTSDSRWSDACIEMLRAFHTEMLRQVDERKWFWHFEQPATLVPVYREHLIKGGALNPNEAWFREMWLCYCRNLHVWDSEPVNWRGGCHRSMPEAYAKGRAAEWYPDIPEANEWKEYSQLVFRDFWRAKDAPQNDTGYMMGPFIVLVAGGDQWTGDDRVFINSEMKRLWERLLVEISPDGLVNPYGPNGGWNSTADYRIAMLERIAAKTRDGRYRYGAHKLLNYLRYQSSNTGTNPAPLTGAGSWLIALAAIWADESVPAVQPNPGSIWNQRGEAIRIPHTDKELTEQLLGNADPRENHGHICCSWYMTKNEWPDKLILRSGWDPGDFFGIVELHPTSFPANPGGIMGLNRWGAPFTQIVTSKGASVENRLLVEDLSQKAVLRIHPDPLRIDEFWRRGNMPDIQSEVTYFRETDHATLARVRVKNMDGLPVIYEREFIFAKNRFLATREIVTFEEAFEARVAPLWNTHNIGPQLGDHWANTFIHQPVAANGTRSMKSPPVDLLVWFAPHSDRQLQVVDRLIDDPRAEACPNQVRYVWEGTPSPGEQLVFTQVYYPHAPYRSRPTSNNPNPNAKAAYANQLEETAHASGISVLQDDPDASILRLELHPGEIEWVVFNPNEATLSFDQHQTSAPYSYTPKTEDRHRER